jgi:hypothetical protein
MNFGEAGQQMQVSVEVTDEMRREAEIRGIPVIDYLDLVIKKGRQFLNEGPALSNAMERIRALRGKPEDRD